MAVQLKGKSAKESSGYDDFLQPIVYGVLPNQLNDEVNLGDLFSKLLSQWKLIFTIMVSGTLLAVAQALTLPSVYQSSFKVSAPSVADIAALTTVNTVLGGAANIPSSQQAVFSGYYNLLRSRDVFVDYIEEFNYLGKLYPNAERSESTLLAALIKGLKIQIEEPVPERKGDYVANPKRLAVSLDVEDEAVGVELLNGFAGYVNQRLVANLQNDTHEIIKNKIEILNMQIAKLRTQHRQDRGLTIKKMEHNNAKEIALLQEQITAYLIKARANRATKIANVREAHAIAKSLDIVYPTTLDAIAQKGQKNAVASTAITVVDKQASLLYLQGTKYLTALIETLKNRKNDEKYLVNINSLREKIHIIKNDQVFKALKKRQSDDPWIKDLPIKLAEISSLKALEPNFSSVIAYSMGNSATVTHEQVKPKRKLIVVIGFMLSLFMAIFIAIVAATFSKEKSGVAEKN